MFKKFSLLLVALMIIGLLAARYPVQQISKKYLAKIEGGGIV